MRKLHYIEAFDHTELIYRWLPVWASLVELEVVCYVKPGYQAEFAAFGVPKNVLITGPSEDMTWSEYLKEQQFPAVDVVVLATLGNRPGWFASLVGHPRYFVVLHNLNYCLGRQAAFSLKKPGTSALRYFYELPRRGAKKRLLSGAAGYLVSDVHLAVNACLYAADKDVRVIPFAVRPEEPAIVTDPDRKEMPFLIIIPGTVSRERRDYEVVVDALRILQKQTGRRIDVHLAGKMADRTAHQMFARHFPVYNNHVGISEGREQVRVYSYDGWLRQAHHQQLLKSADLLLAPLVEEVIHGQYREQLGETKVTGAIADAVAHGKPLLVPVWYPDAAGDFTGYHDAHDLARKLLAYQADAAPTPVRAAYTLGVVGEKWSSLLAE
jgi:hypothetical protein